MRGNQSFEPNYNGGFGNKQSFSSTYKPGGAPVQGGYNSGYKGGRGKPWTNGGGTEGGYQGGAGRGMYNNDGLGKNLRAINWDQMPLEPFTKVFYMPQQHENHSREEIEEYKQNQLIFIQTKHANVPDPMITWEDTQFPDYLIQAVKLAKFKEPTSIQSITFPIVMSGHDFIGIAQTGSGKTVAYLFPGIIHINAQPPIEKGDGPIVLILAPTRELAQQIEEQSGKFGNACQLTSACIFGGVDRGPQQSVLLRGADIVIATPGRLIDFLETRTTNLKRVTYLVLDEADRMLDMGFEPQIRKIVEQIRPDRQTLMFSATWPKEVRNLARDFCNESPLHVQIGNFEHSINKNIEQVFDILAHKEKNEKLVTYLNELTEDSQVLIFCQTQNGCDDLFNFLKSQKYWTMVIHGDKKQESRDFVMDSFRSGQTRILIATDVASRGLDVADITHVINYDFPKQIEDYIHRIGRTGRAGKKGVSISFLLQEEDQRIAGDLIEVLQEAGQHIPDNIYAFADRKRGGKYDNRPRTSAPRTNNSYGGSGFNRFNPSRDDNFKPPQSTSENSPKRQDQKEYVEPSENTTTPAPSVKSLQQSGTPSLYNNQNSNNFYGSRNNYNGSNYQGSNNYRNNNYNGGRGGQYQQPYDPDFQQNNTYNNNSGGRGYNQYQNNNGPEGSGGRGTNYNKNFENNTNSSSNNDEKQPQIKFFNSKKGNGPNGGESNQGENL